MPPALQVPAIDRLSEPASVYQARGTTAHLALQRLFDHPSTQRSPQLLYDLFRDAWTELRGTEEFVDLFGDTDEERNGGWSPSPS